MPPKPAIPASENDITVDWLHQAMEAAGSINFPAIRDVAVEQIGVGVGLAGKILRCHLTYDDDVPGAPETVIVKMPSTDPHTLRVAKRLELYRRECDYYRQLAPHTPIRSPALHYGDFDDRSHHFVLILEDLKEMASPDQIVGADAEQAKTAVRAIAQLHGHYWNRVNQPPVSRFNNASDGSRRLLTQDAYQASLPSIFTRFGSIFTEPMRRLAEEYGLQLAAHQDDVDAGPQTFVHGDYRLDNMLFGVDGDNDAFAVLDWQVCGVSSGLSDVAYFLSSSVDTEIRREIEQEVLAEYHDIIRSVGADDFTFEDCWSSYRQNMLGCFRTPVIAGGQFDFSSQRSQQLADVFLSRTLAAIEDLDASEFLPAQ